MSLNVLKNIKDAIANLNPQEVRDHAERPFRLVLAAGSEDQYREMESFFAPPANSGYVAPNVMTRTSRSGPATEHDIPVHYEHAASGWVKSGLQDFLYRPAEPARVVIDILNRRPELAIPLARNAGAFRQPVIDRLVKKIAKENALFSLATALPDIVPLLSLPWAVTEFASDTAVLTANQIRMAFFIAAACGRPVGYSEQRSEIGTIVLGAFGWRAIARELLGKIPLGGGLIPKAAVAYAATRVVGLSIDRYYKYGSGLSKNERQAAFDKALARGKGIARSMLDSLKRSTQKRQLS